MKEITITIEGQEWQNAIDKAFEKANKEAKIPGFRPGKAPKEVFYKKYGKESLYLDAADIVLNDAYQKMMEENKELKDEEIVEETNTVEDNTEATENEEVEEIMEEYSETDDLSMIRKLKDENKKLSNELEALKDRLLRLTAEYDNYRKRTAKEKEGIYTDACTDVLKEVLPVADNLERALAVDGNVEDLKKGVEMTIKGFLNSLEKLGVEEIDTTNGFDPNLHQAISVVEDANLNSNDVAQVYQKGYKKGEKVIRYSMVTVAK